MLGKNAKKKAVPRKMKIRKGDTVRVIAGKDKGKEGEVIEVRPGEGRLLVHGANVMKKAVRPHPQKNPQGGIIEMPAPLDISNVKLVCPRCSKPSGVVFKKDTEGRTGRKCKKCGELIDA